MEARIERLLAIIDLQLEQLEKDMASADNLSVQDKDRLGRQAGAIVSNLEKVTELNTDHEKARASAPGTRAESDLEAERMRREIAERLERLNAQWLAQEKPR